MPLFGIYGEMVNDEKFPTFHLAGIKKAPSIKDLGHFFGNLYFLFRNYQSAIRNRLPIPPVMRASTAAAQDDRGAEQEPEVVPIAVVVHVVHANRRIEQRDDEGDRGDDPVPQTLPEARYRNAFGGLGGEFIGPRGATGQRNQQKREQRKQKNGPHGFLRPGLG
jgi:hypothetical protein